MTENDISCPLCGSPAISTNDHQMDRFRVDCPKCKAYKITYEAARHLAQAAASEKDKLVTSFNIDREVYGQETVPTIWTNGNEFEVRPE